jgi:DNA-binding PadR family transcriptional regulator
MSTKHAILGVISFGPASGYAIKTEIEKGGLSWIWELSYGSIYPYLERLAAEGLISPIETRTEGRERKVYELTGEGWDELKRWLKEPSAYPVPLRDDLLLRMLFWGTVAPDDRATLIKHLKDRAAASRALLDRLDAPWNGVSASDEYHGLLESYARTWLTADLAWVNEAIAGLEGPPQPPRHDPAGLFERAKERRRSTAQAGHATQAAQTEQVAQVAQAPRGARTPPTSETSRSPQGGSASE